MFKTDTVIILYLNNLRLTTTVPFRLQHIKSWAHKLKTQLYALYLVTKNPNAPYSAKLVITLVIAYALSPIDLIPDFIPIIGLLDDILLLPLGIWLAIKLTPKPIWLLCQYQAELNPIRLSKNYYAALIIGIIWLVVTYYVITILVLK